MSSKSSTGDKPSIPAMSSINYAKWGDIAHILNILTAITFALCVAVFAPQVDTTTSKLFDSLWLKDGFCVSNRDQPFWTSHDICLYADTILTVAFGTVFLVLRKTPGMEQANELVKFYIPGTLAHGFAHGMIARHMRLIAEKEEKDPSASSLSSRLIDDNKSVGAILLALAPILLIFWLPILKATMSNISNSKVLSVAIAVVMGQAFVPQLFGFTYAQTVLAITYSVNQLTCPHKDKTFEYALFPAVVGLPVVIIGWLESTTCSRFMVHIGGHVVYDVYIVLSMMAFYFVSFVRCRKKDKIA